MIIYTDLFNRTKNYSLTKEIIDSIENKFKVTITTQINPKAQIYWGDKFNMEAYSQMPNLKWIHLSKTGYGKFTFPSDVIVTNTPKSSEGVAEYALTGVLYLLRGLDRMTHDRKSFDVNINHIIPFNEVKCLIVGHGRIGKELNNKLTSLGMTVHFVTKGENKINVYELKNYNFIINCLPLNDKTLNYFDKTIFSKMGGAYFINVGRGETVNEQDLYTALKNDTVRGAFLDVVQEEPLKQSNPLLELDNIFISPHIANALKHSLDTQVKEFIFNLINLKTGKPLINIVYDSNNS